MTNIIIVGRLASGKSVLAELLRKKTGFPVYEVGDVVRAECLNNGVKVMPLEYVVEKFDLSGKDYFVKKLLSEVDCEKSNIIVGVRNTEELNFLTACLSNVFTVGISSDRETRKKRYETSRKTKLANSDFDERDRVEESWGINEVIERTDIVLRNDFCSCDEFLTYAEDILDRTVGKREL